MNSKKDEGMEREDRGEMDWKWSSEKSSEIILNCLNEKRNTWEGKIEREGGEQKKMNILQ